MDKNNEFENYKNNQILFKKLGELANFLDYPSQVLEESENSDAYREYVCKVDTTWASVSVKLLALLADGKVADNVIADIDKILRFRDRFSLDTEFFYEFLFWFYERDLKETDITDDKYLKIDSSHYMTKNQIENCVKSFDAETLKSIESIGRARYIFNLEKQLEMGLIPKDRRFENFHLINRFVGRAVKNTNVLFDMITPGEQIRWDDLKNILRHKSITDFNRLLDGIVIFDKEVFDDGCIDNKINCNDLSLFNNNSVYNYQTFLDKCDNDARRLCIFNDDIFNIFQPGAFKNFDVDNIETLKDYGLNKKSIFNYFGYVFLDIFRAIIYIFSGGKKYNEGLFCKSKKLYIDNRNIEQAIDRIKKNKQQELVKENKLTDIVCLQDTKQNIPQQETNIQTKAIKDKNIDIDAES